MNKEYDYYINVIKPLEKKYNRICFLYSIFKFKSLNDKRNFYNLLLINYYKMIKNNNQYSKNIEKEIKYIKK